MLRFQVAGGPLLVLVLLSACGLPPRGQVMETYRPLAIGGRTADSPGNAAMFAVSLVRTDHLVVDGDKIEWKQPLAILAPALGILDLLLPVNYTEREAREPYPLFVPILLFDDVQVAGQSGTDRVHVNGLSSQYDNATSTQINAAYSFLYPLVGRALFASAGFSRTTRRIDLHPASQAGSQTPRQTYLRNTALIVGARWVPYAHTLVGLDADAWQSDTEVESNVPARTDRKALVQAFPFATRVHATVSFTF